MMFAVPAVSVMPTCAAPVIPGLPVAESSAESLSVMVPVKFMVAGVASPLLPPVGSLSQRMVIVSLLSCGRVVGDGDVQACLGVPCWHGYTGFAS